MIKHIEIVMNQTWTLPINTQGGRVWTLWTFIYYYRTLDILNEMLSLRVCSLMEFLKVSFHLDGYFKIAYREKQKQESRLLKYTKEHGAIKPMWIVS